MKCYLCSGKGILKQQKGRSICSRCFCRLIEKRVRKRARLGRFFGSKDNVLAVGEVSGYFLRVIAGNRPMKLFFSSRLNDSFVKKNKINKIVVDWTLDDEINAFLEEILNCKKRKNDKKIKLIANITDKEALLFAKLKGLKFKPNVKNKDITQLVERLVEKHTHAKYSMLVNIEELNIIKDINNK